MIPAPWRKLAVRGSEIVTIYLPQYIVGHWWEHLLHNHRANRMRNKLMMEKGVSISLVPWLLDSSTLIYGRRSRAVAGDARRGEPRTPPVRSHLTPETVEIPTTRRRRRPSKPKV